MSSSTQSGNHQKHEAAKRRQFAFRLNIFFFSVFLLFSVLIVRLAMLQFVEGTQLQAISFENDISSMDIPPIRGNIYDRNGYPIAYSTSTQSLYYRVESQIDKDQAIEMAYHLADIFEKYADPGTAKLTAEEIVLKMDVHFDINKESRVILNYNHIPRRIKTGLSQAEIAYISEHRDHFKGLEIIEESIRNYSTERIAVQLVGYLRPFSTAINQQQSYLDFYKDAEKTRGYLDVEEVGFDGLEFMYQESLRGINGKKSYPVNKLKQIVGNATVEYPTKGNSLYLTIDKDMQLKTEQAIEDHLAFMKSEDAGRTYAMGNQATTGYAVAMEVDTGKVVAMASYPDYDPNIWSGGISQRVYDENQFYFKNGAISESYPNYPDYAERSKHPSSLVPLGSTMKPLTILLGLEEGLITPQTTYNDRGFFTFGADNSRIRNSGSSAFGVINPFEALRRSSNTFMSAMIGNALYMRDGNKAIDIWDEYMEQFGLGVLTGSGLPNEIRGTKEYLNLKQAGSAQAALVFASFGQQGRYTALQLAQHTAMLANKGKRLKPQFVEKITNADGELVEQFEPVILNEVQFEEKHWDLVHGAMKLVRKEGFDDFPYEVAAKTGTSQQQVSGGVLIENAVFIAFAPADDPKLAVAVIVPEGGFGGWGAAPIARKIFEAYDETFGLAF